jgi:tol-pal system protein YbgF
VKRIDFSPRALCAALLLFASAHASAALFDDDEARKRIELTNTRLSQVQKQLEDRIAVLEVQLKNQGLVELFNSVELMKADLAKLRGQVEVLTYELDQSGKRQRDLYVDLDSRLRKLESGPGLGTPVADAGAATAAPGAVSGAAPNAGSAAVAPAVSGTLGTPPVTPGAPPAANEQRAYDAALDQFKSGSYPAAISSFSAFVKAWPRSALAPSAQYWIGNAYFALRDYKGAIAAQQKLIAAWPDSAKAPDAMLNLASSQLELGDTKSAKRSLDSLLARYPASPAAETAKQRLARMK